MRSLCRVILFSQRSRPASVPAILSLCIASSFIISGKALASEQTPVEALTATFGTPKDFADKFEASVKDRSNQVVGLLIAASGFTYAVRVFTH